jgi:hypothetical protein
MLVPDVTYLRHIVPKFENDIIISYIDIKLPFIFNYTNEGEERDIAKSIT